MKVTFRVTRGYFKYEKNPGCLDSSSFSNVSSKHHRSEDGFLATFQDGGKDDHTLN